MIIYQFVCIVLILSSVSAFECTGNGYFRDPTDCAKMVRCSNGKITHRFSCSEGKVFNDITKSCEEPKYVNCQNAMPLTSQLTTISNDITDITKSDQQSTTMHSVVTSTIKSLLTSDSTIDLEVSDGKIKIPNINKSDDSPDLTSQANNYSTTTENISFYITENTLSVNDFDFELTTSSATIESTVNKNITLVLQNETTTLDESTTEMNAIRESIITDKKVKQNKSCYIDVLDEELEATESMNESDFSNIYKIVCYFSNWSRYRVGVGKYTVNNINPMLCTHIIYAFATLDNETLTLKSSDECTDIDNKFYAQIVSLKQKNAKLKVLIALGGWADSEGDKYSRLVNNRTARTNFVTNAIQFVRKHRFDGLDLDWEFPKCWQSDCAAGPDSDKIKFLELIKELRFAINNQSVPLLLTAAVSANEIIIDAAYDASIINYLDFINLMAYDYHTTGSSYALHHSPVYSRPNSKHYEEQIFHANFSTNHWIRKGVSTHKIILGIPFYGRTFKLVNPNPNGSEMGAAVNGSGYPGYYTKESGFLSYYEICTSIVQKGWVKRVNSYIDRGVQMYTGPYAYDYDQWVGYDDRQHLIQKAKFIKTQNLGGAMVWSLDLDDFNGVCCQVKNPLLKTLNYELRGYPKDLNFFCP